MLEASEETLVKLNEEFDYQYSEAWAVWSDYLLDNEHSLGEVIATQQANYLREPATFEPYNHLGVADSRDHFIHRPFELEDGRQFSEGISGYQRYGYQRTLEFRYTADDRDALVALLADERSRFLQKATFVSDDRNIDWFDLLAQNPHRFSWLAELEVRFNLSVPSTHLHKMLAKMPRLTNLSLSGARGTSHLASTTLRYLAMDTESVVRLNLKLPNVIHLSLIAESQTGRSVELNPLFDATGLLKLRHLDLCYLASDELCMRLSKSRIIGQLLTLNLSRGRMSDKGVDTLAKSGALEHLERIDVSENELSRAAHQVLKAQVPKVRFGSQNTCPEEWNCDSSYCDHRLIRW